MLDILLVKIQPMELQHYDRPNDFEYFNSKTLEFKVSVLNGECLQFKASKEFYSRFTPLGSSKPAFDEKVCDINKELGVDYGGHVVAIDKYPHSQFEHGVKINEERNYGFDRYKIENRSEISDYNSIIFLGSGLEPIILSSLNFACYEEQGFCSSFIKFKKEAVLSLKSPLGEVIGIPLKRCNENSLKPNSSILSYTMSFEKVSLPPVILQKLLETRPQLESDTEKETNE